MGDAETWLRIIMTGTTFKVRLRSLIFLLCVVLATLMFPFNINMDTICILHLQAGTDYSPVFYLAACLLSACVVEAYFVEIRKESSRERKEPFCKNMKELFKKREVNVLLFVLFLLGADYGFIESYLFVYLKTLNAPTYLLGLTMTFTCLMGMPVIFVADRIVEKLGRQVVFVLSFLAYTIRMFGYSFLTNPWYSYVFEAFEVWTNQVMWVAAVTYFAVLAPASMLATLAGIAGSVHFNIGLGGGSFAGGIMITHIGMVWTFRTFGIASFFFAIIYIAIQKMYLNKAFVLKAQADISESTTVMTA